MAEVPRTRNEQHLWAPAVHRAVNQRCYFFLLTTSDSRGLVLQDHLEKIRDNLGVSGITSYVVQGPYDLIVRAWMTPLRRYSFLENLDALSDKINLISVSEFSASDVEYGWLGTSGREAQKRIRATGENFFDVLEKVVPGWLDNSTTGPSKGSISALVQNGYLIPVDDQSSRRFFMFLNREESQRHPWNNDWGQRLQEVAEGAGLRKPSVYWNGDGFADAVLKGYFEDGDLLDGISHLQERLRAVGVTGWTLSPLRVTYIGDNESIDGIKDQTPQLLTNILQSPRSSDVVGDKLSSRLGIPANASFVAHYLTKLQSERGLVSNLDNVMRLSRRLAGIMAGLLTENRKRVNRELSFLVSIPADLRDVIEMLDGDLYRFAPSSDVADVVDLVEAYIDLRDFDDPDDADRLRRYARSAGAARAEFMSGDAFSGKYVSGENPVLARAVEEHLDTVADAALLQLHIEEELKRLVSIDFDTG